MKKNTIFILILFWIQFYNGVAQDISSTVLHKVSKGENLFQIAKKYKKSTKELLSFNQLSTEGVQEGQILKIPTTMPTAAPSSVGATTPPQYHTVQQGETFFKIADLYKISLDSLYHWNHLTSAAVLTIHQRLQVSRGESKLMVAEKAMAKIDRKKVVYQVGKGQRIATTSTERVALHRTAPVGSIITVINSSNRLATKVKVIGTIPTIDRNNDVIIKVSEAACKELAVVNEYFAIEVFFEKHQK